MALDPDTQELARSVSEKELGNEKGSLPQWVPTLTILLVAERNDRINL